MIPRFPALCFICEYYVPGVDPENDRGQPVCRAFDGLIQSEILNGGFDHRQPFRNEWFTFKLAADKTEEDLKQWEQEVLDILKQDILAVIQEFKSFENEPWND